MKFKIVYNPALLGKQMITTQWLGEIRWPEVTNTKKLSIRMRTFREFLGVLFKSKFISKLRLALLDIFVDTPWVHKKHPIFYLCIQTVPMIPYVVGIDLVIEMTLLGSRWDHLEGSLGDR